MGSSHSGGRGGADGSAMGRLALAMGWSPMQPASYLRSRGRHGVPMMLCTEDLRRTCAQQRRARSAAGVLAAAAPHPSALRLT